MYESSAYGEEPHTIAAHDCASLSRKEATSYTLRHTCAMRLLGTGTDITTIALWLGHLTSRTTEIYLHAHLSLKERAISRTVSRNLPAPDPAGPKGSSEGPAPRCLLPGEVGAPRTASTALTREKAKT